MICNRTSLQKCHRDRVFDRVSKLYGRVLISQKNIRPYHFGKKTPAPSYGLYLNDTIGFSDRVISKKLAHENLAISLQDSSSEFAVLVELSTLFHIKNGFSSRVGHRRWKGITQCKKCSEQKGFHLALPS